MSNMIGIAQGSITPCPHYLSTSDLLNMGNCCVPEIYAEYLIISCPPSDTTAPGQPLKEACKSFSSFVCKQLICWDCKLRQIDTQLKERQESNGAQYLRSRRSISAWNGNTMLDCTLMSVGNPKSPARPLLLLDTKGSFSLVLIYC